MSMTFDELGCAPVGASAIMHVGEFLFIRIVKADDNAYEGTVYFWKDGTTVSLYEDTMTNPNDLLARMRVWVCGFAYGVIGDLDCED